jgi:hypothetical protein
VPRNYVALENDDVASFDERAFLDALRAGRSFGTSGPLVFARLGDAGPGELFEGSAGELSVEVRAAPWVPVHEVRVYVDAVLEARRPIGAGERVTFPLGFAQDGFVFVEVTGDASGVYADVLPGTRPFAFTNAIRVDANRDGTWQPPGLPKPAPALLADPLARETR